MRCISCIRKVFPLLSYSMCIWSSELSTRYISYVEKASPNVFSLTIFPTSN
ncbi:hypothetical protein IC582_026304 [Cucumis melo]